MSDQTIAAKNMRRRRSNATPAHKGPNKRSHKKAQKAQNKLGETFVLFVPFVAKFFCVLALNDLYVRVELHIEVARINLLVLFQIRETHRGRVVVLLDDLRLHRHTG